MKGPFLVTGANGFIGRELCKELVRRNYLITGATRSDSGHDSYPTVHIADVGLNTDWTVALKGIETVIHLAARVHVMHEVSRDSLSEFRRVNVEGTENLALQAVAAGVQRMVYVSSIGVNGLQSKEGKAFLESDDPNPHNAYALSKWEAEQSLLCISAETGLEIVIVRPPLVYGANAPGNFEQMIKVLKRGIPLPLASVNNQRSLIYLGNLLDALILCAVTSDAKGKTFLVSDGEDVSTPELLRRLGSAIERPARLFSCPVALLRLAGQLTGKTDQIDRLLGSLQVDSNKIRSELSWTPPYSLQQGLHKTAQWYRDTHQ
jgi:nucleoside-diphosphate-sugar epimerase